VHVYYCYKHNNFAQYISRVLFFYNELSLLLLYQLALLNTLNTQLLHDMQVNDSYNYIHVDCFYGG